MGVGPRIPVGEALLRGSTIMESMKPAGQMIIAGSIRRGEAEVGDLDLVVVGSLHNSHPYEGWESSHRPPGYILGRHFMRGGFRVDVFQAAPYNLGTVLVYATGSKEFNAMLEVYVNRTILWGSDCPTEELFFERLLRVPYVPPHLRGDPGIIQAYARLMAAACTHSDRQ